MQDPRELRRLGKFILTSAICLFVGSTHGVIQVLPPVRRWLDAIGSPIQGPGRMIDPLAHAHISVLGGVIVFAMGAMYYMLMKIYDRPLYSQRLVEHSFWWTTIGIVLSYLTFLGFGIVEGNILLSDPGQLPPVHRFYGPVLSCAGIVLTTGFLIFLINIVLSLRGTRK